MNQFVLLIGCFYGALAIILGAFAAHSLKNKTTPKLLKSFETGVKYQMYHALLLLYMGKNFDYDSPYETYASQGIILGTFLFSFSIYGLVFSATKHRKIKLLGPITPIGGLFLLAGWSLMGWHYLST
ncbi:DUF423 domain-containing protein [Flavicella sp.]|nr:DUF423 domain-containing protein [Flavicella sp.]MDA9111514.1 DUF423 domain-containing protein [Flavicella sp.]